MPDTVQQPDPEATGTVATADSDPAAKRGRKGKGDKRGGKRRKDEGPKVRRRSIFEDRTVRTLGLGAGVLVLIYLVVIVAALLTGVLAGDQPQTMADRDLRIYRDLIEKGSVDEKHWAAYAEALISFGNLTEAQAVIDRAAEAGITDPQFRGLDAAQARLYYETGKYEECVELSEKTVAQMEKQGLEDYEAAMGGANPTPLGARQWPDPYWQMRMLIASGHEKLGQDEEAAKALTDYLVVRPVAGDVLEWRGDIYARMGKIEEARADYEKAIQFMTPGELRDALQAKIDDLGSN